MMGKKLQIDTGPQLPLSERPIQAEVSLQELLRWHSTAEAQAKAIGAAFAEDDGPSPEDLLVWVLWPLISPELAASQQVCISVEQICMALNHKHMKQTCIKLNHKQRCGLQGYSITLKHKVGIKSLAWTTLKQIQKCLHAEG